MFLKLWTYGWQWPSWPFDRLTNDLVDRFYAVELNRILSVGISLGTKFQLKLKTLIFWAKLAQKGYFQSKTEWINITIEFCILELVWLPNFTFIKQLRIFGISGRNEKSEYHHWILHTRIILQPWTKYLRQTLVFMWNIALQEKFNFYFSAAFW